MYQIPPQNSYYCAHNSMISHPSFILYYSLVPYFQTTLIYLLLVRQRTNEIHHHKCSLQIQWWPGSLGRQKIHLGYGDLRYSSPKRYKKFSSFTKFQLQVSFVEMMMRKWIYLHFGATEKLILASDVGIQVAQKSSHNIVFHENCKYSNKLTLGNMLPDFQEWIHNIEHGNMNTMAT